MKKKSSIITIFSLAFMATLFFSFSEVNTSNYAYKSNSATGKDIFTKSGCAACHQATTKSVGPSIKTIAIAYKGNKKGLIAFFKGTGKVLVDPAMEAVMKPQIDVTKKMTSKDQIALADYILSVK